MLNENIKAIRKSKGLSQQELSVKLNVVRQTVSKWEQGLSVPDSDMLISISEALETPVSILLGETVTEPKADELKAISEKLEIINLQLAQRKASSRKMLQWFLISLCAVIVIISQPWRYGTVPIWVGIMATLKPPLLESAFTHLSGCSSEQRRLSLQRQSSEFF